jgi:hypothetical protein
MATTQRCQCGAVEWEPGGIVYNDGTVNHTLERCWNPRDEGPLVIVQGPAAR